MRCCRSKLRTIAVITGAVSSTLVSCATTESPPTRYDIRALADPKLIERGRYLVYGPSHCAACHGDPARETEMRYGGEIPLSGGRVFDLGPLGRVVAPNITSDSITGIGALSDDTLVRSLRYGISRRGRPLVPIMSFADLSDDDLRAVLSFLRTLPSVARTARQTQLSWLGTLAVNVVLHPARPMRPVPPRVMPERSAEYGRYLAHTVANCYGCHTRRSRLTGAFVGPDFGGGMEFEEHGRHFVAPNLTPIPTGVVQASTEEQFIQRFRSREKSGILSPMPWEAFARMTDSDLAAIYRYLRTLPPAESS
jgi:mono/diheme cytochrome c family protein